MVSCWSLSYSRYPQVSRTLLSILSDLNNAEVWIISTCPLISMSSSPCTNPLVTVSRAPIKLVKLTFMVQSFSLPSEDLGISLSFNFIQWSTGTAKSIILPVLSFSSWLIQGLVVLPIFGYTFVSQNPRGVCVFHFPGEILDCAFSIYLYDQTSTSCTISSGSPCPPSHV